MAQVHAEWELLQSVTLLVVIKANEASYDTKVDIVVSIGDDSHFNEMSRFDALLEQIVNSILTQGLHCGLVLVDLLLDVLDRTRINLSCHFLIVLNASPKL